MAKIELTQDEKIEKAVKLGYARELNFWRMSDYPEVREVVDTLYKEFLQKHPNLNRSPSKYRHHIKTLVLDAYVAYETDFELYIVLSRRRGDYNTKSRYKFMAYRITMNVLDFLIDGQYLEYHPGFNNGDGGYRSRIRSMSKLLWLFMKAQVSITMVKRNPEEPLVRLKDAEGHLVEFKDTSYTRGLEVELREFASLYENQKVEIELTPSDLDYLRKYFKQKRRSFDTSVLRFRRTFLRDFKHGSRLSGGWYQSFPEDYRQRITINGKPVCEMDYESLHPTMLYHLHDLIPPEGDLYRLPGVPETKEARKFIKRFMLTIINAKSEEKAIKAIRRDINYSKKSWKGITNPIGGSTNADLGLILRKLKAKHKGIAKYFCTNQGVWLQKHEADINMNVLRKFKHKELPLPLPEYDSFIVSADQETALKRAMLESYKEIIGFQYSIGVEKKY